MGLAKIAEKFVLNKLNLIQHGNLRLINYDGKVYHFGNLKETLTADLKIFKKKFYFNIILGGGSALGEAYMNKDVSSSNLTTLIELLAKNIAIIYSFSGKIRAQVIKNIIKRIFASNTKSNSLKFISKHYDLGNDFFSKWLDKTLTYSSAIYKDKNDNLEIAQKNKYQKLIDLTNLKDGDKILEIGCGWGGFSEYLAKKHNVIIDCITISKKQYEFSKQRIHKAGLNNKVNVLFLDYRDLKNKYDKIFSIEMIEAVGEKYLNQYFKTIKNSLNHEGQAALQGITIKDELFERYRNSEDFIQKYIFPGGFLPSINYLKKMTNTNNLVIKKIYSYSDDYAKTLSTWRKNFLSTWDNISTLGFDDYFKRMWEFYLSYCEAGFKSKNIDLIQFSMSNR